MKYIITILLITLSLNAFAENCTTTPNKGIGGEITSYSTSCY